LHDRFLYIKNSKIIVSAQLYKYTAVLGEIQGIQRGKTGKTAVFSRIAFLCLPLTREVDFAKQKTEGELHGKTRFLSLSQLR